MALTPYQQIQQVRDHYNTIGLDFAETRKKRLWAEILPFLKLIKPGMRVLDVGCGSGRLLSELSKRKIDYLGLDFSEVLLQQAKKSFPKERFLLRDITTEDGWQRVGEYDAIFCLGVLHHIPDRKTQHDVLRQMYLHTKPDGFVVISVWNLWQFRFWKYHLKQVFRKIKSANPSYVWIPYSISDGQQVVKKTWRFCKAFGVGELIQLVKQVGYQIDSFYYASKGKTHLSIFKGENFCLLARKKVE